MRKRAAGLYRSNPDTVRLHQKIVRLRQEGFLQKEIAEVLPMSLSQVQHHLWDNCNCKNGRRATDAAAGPSGAADVSG